jgi:hypothetical protein
MNAKSIKGFQTGDMVSADVPKGKRKGFYVGRVAVRATGSFNIQTAQGVVQGISHRHCRITQRADGYGYSFSAAQSLTNGTKVPAFLPQPANTARLGYPSEI